jgi:hypothetical protein
VATTKSEARSTSPLERVAFTVPEICFRNNISVPTYQRLRKQGLGPKEMRFGLNGIRVTAAEEREWQERLQQPNPDLEQQATERAVKAGNLGAKSSKHVSKRGRRRASDHKNLETRQT